MSICHDSLVNTNSSRCSEQQARCRNVLVSISSDCLHEITKRLGIETLATLLQSGDKVLSNKLAQCVLALEHLPKHHKQVFASNVVSSLVSRLANLKSLSMTRCSNDTELLDCNLLPRSLIRLAIRPCPTCSNPPRPQVLYSSVPIWFPNLAYLNLDVPSLSTFPLDMSCSPNLVYLRIYLRYGDSSFALHRLLQEVPQLTSLKIKTPSSEDTDLTTLDCAKLPNLTHLSLPCETQVANVHKSFRRITLTCWNGNSSFDTLFEHANNFAQLTHLDIGSLTIQNLDGTLKHISNIAPLIETLNVVLNPFELSLNVFLLFPKLCAVQPCLAFNPSVWPTVPKNVSLLPSRIVWEFSEWFIGEKALLSLKEIVACMSFMPTFKKIHFDGLFCTDYFLRAVPDRVLQNVEHLQILPSVAANRLVLLAKRVKHLEVDFFCHFIDMSNCTQLRRLELFDDKIYDPAEAKVELLEKSLATITSPIEDLFCFLQTDLDVHFYPLSISLASRLTSLCYFRVGLILDGDLNTLPSTLEYLELDCGWDDPPPYAAIVSFLQERTTAFSPLVMLKLYFRFDMFKEYTSCNDWVLDTRFFSSDSAMLTWTRLADAPSDLVSYTQSQ